MKWKIDKPITCWVVENLDNGYVSGQYSRLEYAIQDASRFQDCVVVIRMEKSYIRIAE